jgi:hypothetical protein
MRRFILRLRSACFPIAILLLLGRMVPAHAGAVEICASRLDPADWEELFSKGSIVVPKHIVFQFSGHIFGTLMDPADQGHSLPRGGWRVSPAETQRRTAVAKNDALLSQRGYLAFMTVRPLTLTAQQPCASASVEQVLSQQWGWTRTGIAADRSVYFGVYAVYEEGGVVTTFSDDSNPFFFAAARGEINASVTSSIGNAIALQDSLQDQSPR